MMHVVEHRPTFRTAEEHDIYILGLVCGTLSALKEWAEDPGFLGIEQVEETLETMIADVESAAEFGEESFAARLKDELSGTRISPQALIKAWELGRENGLRATVGPLPQIDKTHHKE